MVDHPPPTTGHAVRLDQVSKTFDTGTQALHDVSFQAERGEFVSIVGPSGCGKSTILRLLAGLLPTSSGEVSVNGSAVVGPRQDVGMMFQQPTLLPWRTAVENVMLPAHIGRRGGRDKAELDKAMTLIEMVGLTGFEHTYPQHLSGGMQQRVALARLLMIGADVLLLDEPFAAVDELTRDRLNLELLDIHARTGATVLLVTHNLTEATLLADRVLVMTPRPSSISAEVTVTLPRPRTLAMTATAPFQELVLEARDTLEKDQTDVPVPTGGAA